MRVAQAYIRASSDTYGGTENLVYSVTCMHATGHSDAHGALALQLVELSYCDDRFHSLCSVLTVYAYQKCTRCRLMLMTLFLCIVSFCGAVCMRTAASLSNHMQVISMHASSISFSTQF